MQSHVDTRAEEEDARRKVALQKRLRHRQFAVAEVEKRKAERLAQVKKESLRTQAMRGTRDVADNAIPPYLRAF